jgi:thiol:disulfide interchange protein DsbD
MLRALNGVLLLIVSATVSQAELAAVSQIESAPVALAEEELLDPEIAFRFSARLISRDTLEVQYRIADGYYMYRDRFRFSVQPESIGLGEPQFPPGQLHEDDFFGASEVYRDEVTIRLPLEPALQSRQGIRLVAISQGCADAGVCYLPTTQFADFESLGLSGGASLDQ